MIVRAATAYFSPLQYRAHVCTRARRHGKSLTLIYMICARYRRAWKAGDHAVPRDINNVRERKEKSMKNQIIVYRTRFPGEEGSVATFE